jgi:hypothetical protein
MGDPTLLLAILIPGFGVFVLLALWLYFTFNRKAERLQSQNKNPDGSDKTEPIKINPLALDLVLTLGTVYIVASVILVLSMMQLISDATVGALLAGMIGFVLGNRLGKSI